MRITFGLALDGPSHPEPLGDRRAAHGELRVGPMGLLALLERADGMRAVVDIKWGGFKYRRIALRENAALQLALYGHLLAQDGRPWPACAYLVLDPPGLLSPDASAFPGAVHVPGATGSLSDLWATVGPTWRWRRSLLDRGAIEVTAAGTEPDDDSVAPSGCRLTETECAFNDYESLTGFAHEEHP